jgi:hypothetical protein
MSLRGSVDGLAVVGIRADEHDVLPVIQHLHHVLDHGRDDVGLLPCGHHDGDGLFRLGVQLLRAQRPQPAGAVQRPPPHEAPHPVPAVDEEVVQGRQQDEDRQDGGRPFEDGVQLGEVVE